MAKYQLREKQGEEESKIPLSPAFYSQSKAHSRRRALKNFFAAGVIRVCGVSVLFCVLAIFLVILAEAMPLFRKAEFSPRSSGKLADADNQLAGFFLADSKTVINISRGGTIEWTKSQDTNADTTTRIKLGGAAISAAALRADQSLLLGTSDSKILTLDAALPQQSGSDFSAAKSVTLDPLGEAEVRQIAASAAGPQSFAAALLVNKSSESRVVVYSTKLSRSMVDSGKLKEAIDAVELPAGVSATTLAVAGSGKLLFIGTGAGDVLTYDLRSSPLRLASSTKAAEVPITAIDVLIGDQTVITGSARGEISSWGFGAQDPLKGASLQKFYNFKPHADAIKQFVHSERNRSFLSLDRRGGIALHFGTSGQTLAQLATENTAFDHFSLSAKGDALLAVSPLGIWQTWNVENPHPEATLAMLFGKVRYEGYADGQYVWQSSSGSDAFESKLSFIPLIFGTLKGTFYCLLFAVPLAIFSALYTSEFMSPKSRSWIKPVIELMAALPSVVIGFIAGLWLAPRLAHDLAGLMLLPILLLVTIFIARQAWTKSLFLRRKFPSGHEALFLLPLLLGAGWLSFTLGHILQAYLPGGNLIEWASITFGINYDQRNSLVVGLAMGFAIVPIIYTIAEDAFSSVPQHLRAASLALGANRWQTAVKVIIPAASPGVFSAVMLGFGRAVGETMIVLMATGNTPLLDFSPFNGFRALSANIAVELPEAAVGGTLYRVLFLASLMLFCVTFVVNSLSELVRQRLRRKYSQA